MPLFIVSLCFPIIVSVTYFSASTEANLYRRMLCSAHGVLLDLSMGYAFAASYWSSFDDWYRFIWPFYLLLAGYVFSTVYSLWRYNGTKLVHVFQPFQLLFAVGYWLIGSLAIAHDSI